MCPIPNRLLEISPPRAVVDRVRWNFWSGRITGTADARIVGDTRLPWAEVDLASGLMEITYDTGAKVILQGPVTY